MIFKRLRFYLTLGIVVLPILIFILTTLNSRCNSQNQPQRVSQDSSSNNEEERGKVLCLILTSEKSFLKRARSVWMNWARKCDKTLFACNCENMTRILNSDEGKMLFNNNSNEWELVKSIPMWQLDIVEDYKLMAKKVFYVLTNAFEKYQTEFKWYLLADDDTFIFVDHLYKFIKTKSHTNPQTYGYNFKVIVPGGYHSGGGGTLLTHEALRRVTANVKTGVCNYTTGYGDLHLGFCCNKSNVTLGDSLDELGRERFHPLSFPGHFKGGIPDWLRKYSSNGIKIGDDCCSDESISFHYTSEKEMDFYGSIRDTRLFKNIYNVFHH